MKTEPIVPAQLDCSAEGPPFSSIYGDVYHPAAGALLQARHVFIAGNGLPERWRGRDRFVVLETGFGLGNNFLATWDAWRRDAYACRQLHFLSIERHPLTRDAMRTVPRDPSLAALATELADAWPALVPNLHRLAFDEGRVQLLLALGDVAAWLPEIVAQADAFYLDGFAPDRNPQMWQPRLFKAMGRMAAPGATAATWSAARDVRDGLSAAGFEVRLAPGTGGKRDITLARFAPAFVPRRAPSRRSVPESAVREVLIVGAGLAGCAAAWALAQQGIASRVLDRRSRPAQEASGNPAGLFHGIVNAQDGTHARFNRAAALEAARVVERAITQRGVAGSVRGLLRLDTSGLAVAAMRDTLVRLGLPADYVRAVDAGEGSELCGVTLNHPAWLYSRGGWVDPAGLAGFFLAEAAPHARFLGGVEVHAVQCHDDRWQALDASGALIAEANAVVLAHGDAARLLDLAPWPLERRRGQISMADADRIGALPRLPIAGAGYLLPRIGGHALFGATSDPDEDTPAPRVADHARNIAQLERLTGHAIDLEPAELQGRVGWRWTSADRLPLIGAVPDAEATHTATRLDQPRMVPRLPGAFMFTGLGSRGITWCALGAQVLASWISGAPQPLEASLLDAVDPARFLTRTTRRGA
jgi:tRNA 5-methylaminomethyl-2-thiouridine biosynthesis bifunctional protein